MKLETIATNLLETTERCSAVTCTQMRVTTHQSRRWEFTTVPQFPAIFRPIWHLNDQYLFFSVQFVEEKTLCSRLEICLQLSTKMSQNTPKVVHFIKSFLGGACPQTTIAYARYARLIVLVIVIPLFSICCPHLCRAKEEAFIGL